MNVQTYPTELLQELTGTRSSVKFLPVEEKEWIRVRLSREILSAGENVYIFAEVNQGHVFEISIEYISESEEPKLVYRLPCGPFSHSEFACYILPTEKLEEGHYRVIFKVDDIEKTEYFSVVANDESLSELYEELFGKDKDLPILLNDFKLNDLQDLFEGWEVDAGAFYENQEAIGMGSRLVQANFFLSTGIENFLSSFINSGQQIKYPVKTELRSVDDLDYPPVDLSELVWMLSCVSTLIPDYFIYGDQVALYVEVYRGEIFIRMQVEGYSKYRPMLLNVPENTISEPAAMHQFSNSLNNNPLLQQLEKTYSSELRFSAEEKALAVRVMSQETRSTEGAAFSA